MSLASLERIEFPYQPPSTGIAVALIALAVITALTTRSRISWWWRLLIVAVSIVGAWWVVRMLTWPAILGVAVEHGESISEFVSEAGRQLREGNTDLVQNELDTLDSLLDGYAQKHEAPVLLKSATKRLAGL